MTRQEYMTDSTANHHSYYLQFALDLLEARCASYCRSAGYTPEFIRSKLSEDPNLNNLERGWMTSMDSWTINNKSMIAQQNEKLGNGRVYSLCDGVCILKAYMRHIAGQEEK